MCILALGRYRLTCWQLFKFHGQRLTSGVAASDIRRLMQIIDFCRDMQAGQPIIDVGNLKQMIGQVMPLLVDGAGCLIQPA